MKAVSSEFRAIAAGPHRVVAQVDIYEASGALVAAAAGCVSGTVTLDRNAAVFGRFSGQFVGLDQTLVARLVKDRCELRVSRGVELTPTIPELPVWLTDENGAIITTEDGTPIYVDEVAAVAGSTETFPLGRFVVTDVRQDLRTLEVDIDAMDASYLVAERRLDTEYQAVAGTPVADHIDAILSAALRTDPPTNFVSTPNQATTVVVGIDQDPWRACTDLARAVGLDLRVNELGEFVLVPVPALSSATPTWTIDGGIESGTVGWSWVVEAETVQVIGSSPAASDIYSGVSTEDDAAAAGYGSRRRLVVRDENIGSDTQAEEVAETIRRQQRGSTRTVDLSGWWPWAEPTDVVRIVTGNETALDELRMLDQVSIPLVGPVRLGTRRDDLVAALRPPEATASKVTVEWIEGVVTDTSPFEVDGFAATKLASYTPTLNDKVQVHRSGGRRLVVGKVG